MSLFLRNLLRLRETSSLICFSNDEDGRTEVYETGGSLLTIVEVDTQEFFTKTSKQLSGCYNTAVNNFLGIPSPLRKLTADEIAKLSARPFVKKVAVENFLSTVHNNVHVLHASKNLEMDTGLYGWNNHTVRAIREGVLLSAGVLDPVGTDDEFYTAEQIKALEEARQENDTHLGIERRYK